jgi:inhibitor of KinA
MAPPAPLRISPAGDSALRVRLAEDLDPTTFERVMAALAALDAGGWPAGWTDVLPGYTSVLVVFDPLVTTHAEVQAAVERALLAGAALPPPDGRLVEIPVRYHPEVAPDLEALLAEKSLSLDELVARHTAPVYLCHMLGFRPGFPFLGGLDPSLFAPRLPTPRTTVPAGSVGIGGRQTGIYPSASPGGWRLIGRTSAALFDPQRSEPFLIRPGDRVRFRAVDRLE